MIMGLKVYISNAFSFKRMMLKRKCPTEGSALTRVRTITKLKIKTMSAGQKSIDNNLVRLRC